MRQLAELSVRAIGTALLMAAFLAVGGTGPLAWAATDAGTQHNVTFEVRAKDATHPGDNLGFAIRVHNKSGLDFTGIAVTSNLPGLDLSAFPVTLPAGLQSSEDIFYEVRPEDVPSFNATFTLTGTVNRGEFGGDVSVDIPLNLNIDVASMTVIKTVNGLDEVEIELGTPVDYSVEVRNTGGVDLYEVWLEDDPLGIRRKLQDLPAGGTARFDVPPYIHDEADFAAGPFVNNAVVTACYAKDEFEQCIGELMASDTAGVSLTPTRVETGVDLSVAKSVDVPTPGEGQEVTFTVTVTNEGPDDARRVVLRDMLPAGLTYNGHTTSQGIYEETSGVWEIGDLASGAAAELTITATVDAGTAGQTLTNTARLTNSNPTDRAPGNNTASTSVTPIAPVDTEPEPEPEPAPEPEQTSDESDQDPSAPPPLPVTGGSSGMLILSGLLALGAGLYMRRR